jgi:hypothetical protein
MDIEIIINYGIKVFFYLILGIALFLSLFGVYIFIKHGEHRMFTTVVSTIFGAAFLVITSIAIVTLSQI